MAIDNSTILANQAQARSLGVTIPGVGSASATPSLPSGATGSDNSDLNSFLSSNLDPYEQTIMQQYQASKDATSNAGAAATKSITDTANYNLGYQSEMDQASGTSALEGGRGFIINPGQLKILQDQSTKRIRDLTGQMNDALASNNTEVASKLADLALQENTAITNARTTFLNQYFQGKQEQRSEQSFQTPQQTAVTSLITQYPDAGILSTDDIATATNKIKSAPSYKQNISKGNADIQNALSQAAQSSSQAAQTNTLLSMINGVDSNNSDVKALHTGALTPQQLINNNSGYGSLGGAYAKAVLAQFQKDGGSVNQATLNGLGQQNTTDALTSGSPWSLLGGLASQGAQATGAALFGNNGSRSLSAPSSGVTPSGVTYTIH